MYNDEGTKNFHCAFNGECINYIEALGQCMYPRCEYNTRRNMFPNRYKKSKDQHLDPSIDKQKYYAKNVLVNKPIYYMQYRSFGVTCPRCKKVTMIPTTIDDYSGTPHFEAKGKYITCDNCGFGIKIS